MPAFSRAPGDVRRYDCKAPQGCTVPWWEGMCAPRLLAPRRRNSWETRSETDERSWRHLGHKPCSLLAPLLGQHAGAGEERQGGHGDCSSALFGRVCAEACCPFERVLWLERCEHSDLAARRRRGGGDAASLWLWVRLALCWCLRWCLRLVIM